MHPDEDGYGRTVTIYPTIYCAEMCSIRDWTPNGKGPWVCSSWCLSVAEASHEYQKEQFVTIVVTMGNSDVRHNSLMSFILWNPGRSSEQFWDSWDPYPTGFCDTLGDKCLLSADYCLQGHYAAGGHRKSPLLATASGRVPTSINWAPHWPTPSRSDPFWGARLCRAKLHRLSLAKSWCKSENTKFVWLRWV